MTSPLTFICPLNLIVQILKIILFLAESQKKGAFGRKLNGVFAKPVCKEFIQVYILIFSLQLSNLTEIFVRCDDEPWH